MRKLISLPSIIALLLQSLPLLLTKPILKGENPSHMKEVLPLPFLFRDKIYYALVFVSLLDESSFVFATLKDEELIQEFGKEIDFETDLETVVVGHILGEEFLKLANVILQAAKQQEDFINQKSLLKHNKA